MMADGHWLSESLRGTQWKLLAFGAQPNIGKNLNLVQANDPALTKVYGLSEGYVLIRPDGHIALIASSAEEISAYFAQFQNRS